MRTRTTGFRDAQTSRRGGVLVLSLVAVGVVASLSVAYLQLSASVTRRQVGAADTKLAFYLAEAGLAESYSGIMVGRTGAVGSEAAPALLGDGLLWVEATPLDDDHVGLEAVGMARSGQARLGMVVRRGKANRGGLGIFAEEDMTIGDGSLIDGYDSGKGDYDDQSAADPSLVQKGTLGSNGSITITSARRGTSIHGNVKTGPGEELILNGSPVITGETGAALSPVVLAPVRTPGTVMLAGVSQAAGAPLVVPAGTFGAQFLDMQPDSEVVLQGPLTLVLNGLRVAPGAELTFDTSGGEIHLYVSNLLDLDPGAYVTCTESQAERVSIEIAGEATAALDATSEFHGLIYAPEAAVSVGAAFELFGGLVGREVALANGVSMHHDRSLVPAGEEDALPKLLSWRILELPENSRDTMNVDPFALLGVDAATSPRPADAHLDQLISVVYYDVTATLQNFTGLESALDWGDVRQVVELERTGGLIEADIAELSLLGALGVRRFRP